VFSGAEIAILSLRRTRLDELVEAGDGGAEAVSRLRQNPEQFLATVQVGITVVGASAAAYSGQSLSDRIAPWIASVGPLASSAQEIAFVLVVAGVSYLSLVLGELVPKSLALRAGEPYALAIGRPLASLAWAARPLVWLLTASSNVVLRLFGDRTSFSESRLSSEELQQMVGEAASAGTLDPSAGEIASRAFDFGELDASSVMVPRHEIVGVQRDATLDDLARLVSEHRHSRYPVHDGDLDSMTGFIEARDMLARGRSEPDLNLADHIQAMPFIPASMPATAVLRALQEARVQMAGVVDEQGTITGVVTLTDLMEELVGERLGGGEASVDGVKRQPDGSWHIEAGVGVHEVNRSLGVELPEGEGYATIAGLVLDMAGRIPAPGERFEVEGHTLEIIEATHRRIKRVRLSTTAE
jgi:putative hemolysin